MTFKQLSCILVFLFGCRADDGSFEIVGGEPIKIESAPFMAIYREKGQIHGCGASIVTHQFLVTAAHCYSPFSQKSEIVVGTDNINRGHIYEISKVIVHPKYQYFDYDVALIKLVKNLIFSAKVQPIKLAEPGMVIEDGAVLQTMGFGFTELDVQSDILLAVNVPYVNDVKCSSVYPIFTDRMICAGIEGKDSCQNDSGGPLRYNDTLVGIVSFGKECGEKGYPGVYARVSQLRDFIDKTIREN